MTVTQVTGTEAAGFGGKPGAVILSNYRPIGKNTLVGVCDIKIPRWHLRFRGCLYHRKNDKEWMAFASREWIDQRDRNGKYADLIQFTDRITADRFQAAVLPAIRELAQKAVS